MTPHPDRTRSDVGPAAQITKLLQQLAALVECMDDAQYQSELAREVSGSVGGHVRHSLDHISALMMGIASGQVSYDARLRGTAVESRRDAALHEIGRLLRDLRQLHASSLDTPLDVVLSASARGTPAVARSTMARELEFVSSHTIHHFAIVALLLREMGVRVPPRFGYAPSTPSPELAA